MFNAFALLMDGLFAFTSGLILPEITLNAVLAYQRGEPLSFDFPNSAQT